MVNSARETQLLFVPNCSDVHSTVHTESLRWLWDCLVESLEHAY